MAKINSQTGKAENTTNELLQLVSFNIGEEEFGVDILKVQEINRMVEVTRVPNAPEYVQGVINLRGKVIPIIDLRMRLEMPVFENNKDTRIIVVEINQKIIGFIVDRVNEVLRINTNITEAPPPMVSSVNSEFITSIGKLEDRLLILLDLDKVLTVHEKEVLDEAVA